MKEGLKKLLGFLSRTGAAPTETDETRIHRMVYVGASFASVPALLLYGSLFLHYGAPLAALAMFGYLAVSVLCLILFGLTRRHFHTYLKIFISTHLLASLAVTYVLGGISGSAVHAVWGLLTPLGALVVLSPRAAIRWFLMYLVLLATGLAISQAIAQPMNILPPRALLYLSVMNISGVSVFAFGILNYFVQQRDRLFRLLSDERERSEELLLNILPKEVVSILRDRPQTIADHFDGATILFADVVNFTPLAAKLTPKQTVDLLNQVFSHFDTLVDKYGVEKIKTIGDCYMVASGVPRPRHDHAQVLVRLALEMRDFVDHRQFNGERLELRIGINSGPVVAGVIGQKKFIYDLWGDAVNTASRMESHGGAGVIQITGATYDLIGDDFICEPRGKIEVKGKGEMEVWQVTR
jgi:guanylate cyclase